MKCPQCAHEDTKVLESRLSLEGRSVRRRRSCPQCAYRFTTYEKEEEFVFHVQKKDGRIEPYQRAKLNRSIEVACQKRPITPDDIDSLIMKIERRLQDEGTRTVSSQALGSLVLAHLNDLDKVAYVRFASVYKEFKDPQEFVNELQSMS